MIDQLTASVTIRSCMWRFIEKINMYKGTFVLKTEWRMAIANLAL
jgi:hypothetical protein